MVLQFWFHKSGIQEYFFQRTGIQEYFFQKTGIQGYFFQKNGIQEYFFQKTEISVLFLSFNYTPYLSGIPWFEKNVDRNTGWATLFAPPHLKNLKLSQKNPQVFI